MENCSVHVVGLSLLKSEGAAVYKPERAQSLQRGGIFSLLYGEVARATGHEIVRRKI